MPEKKTPCSFDEPERKIPHYRVRITGTESERRKEMSVRPVTFDMMDRIERGHFEDASQKRKVSFLNQGFPNRTRLMLRGVLLE